MTHAVVNVLAWMFAGLLAVALIMLPRIKAYVDRPARTARTGKRRWMSESEFREEAAAAECGEIPTRHKDAA